MGEWAGMVNGLVASSFLDFFSTFFAMFLFPPFFLLGLTACRTQDIMHLDCQAEPAN
jgi:hypothetical protein